MIVYRVSQYGDVNLRQEWLAIENDGALRVFRGFHPNLAFARMGMLDVEGAVVGVQTANSKAKWVEPYTQLPLKYKTEILSAAEVEKLTA